MISCTYPSFLRVTQITSLNPQGFLRRTEAQFGSVLRATELAQHVSWAAAHGLLTTVSNTGLHV